MALVKKYSPRAMALYELSAELSQPSKIRIIELVRLDVIVSFQGEVNILL